MNFILNNYFDIKIPIIFLALLCMSGCSTVRFNERQYLSRTDMKFDGRPLQAEMESHVFSAREGASGTFAVGGGGGCGCY